MAETKGRLPAVGQPFGDFALTGTDGAIHTLQELLADHRGLVMFFFPKANTDG